MGPPFPVQDLTRPTRFRGSSGVTYVPEIAHQFSLLNWVKYDRRSALPALATSSRAPLGLGAHRVRHDGHDHEGRLLQGGIVGQLKRRGGHVGAGSTTCC